MPREDGYKNLIKRTPEELREMSRRGGLANKQRIEREKTMNELAKALLKAKTTDKKARSILGDYADFLQGDYSLECLVLMRQIVEAMDGNTKSAEFIRDTAGYKPTEKQEITAEIMTDADRILLEKVAKRQGIPTEKQD